MCSCSRTSTRTTRTSSCASRSPQSFRDRWSRANCLCGCSPTSSPNSDDTRPPPPCSKQKPTGQSTQGRRRQCRGRGLRRRSRRWGALTPATHCRSMSTRGRALVPAPTPCCLLGRGKVPWRDRRASLWGRNSRDRDRSRDRCRDRGRCRNRCRNRCRDRCRGRGRSRGRGRCMGKGRDRCRGSRDRDRCRGSRGRCKGRCRGRCKGSKDRGKCMGRGSRGRHKDSICKDRGKDRGRDRGRAARTTTQGAFPPAPQPRA
mmetsp:Transcript_19674/g.42737  ORF Transcript_19674/g.42737 Transcript_19674/m.42737 type:complete len:259 (+) Transcript_19674:844-1620(+)